MENLNYYLVLERLPGDKILIDINKLDICNRYVSNKIADIDFFTLNFTLEEIKESIIRSNMAKDEYRNGTIKIISDARHNLKPVTKDVHNTIMEFQNNEEEIDINFKNKLLGEYKNIVNKAFNDQGFKENMVNRFNSAINEYNNSLKDNDVKSNKEGIFKIIEELPYQYSRRLYIKMDDELNKKKIDKKRKLEKLNDVI